MPGATRAEEAQRERRVQENIDRWKQLYEKLEDIRKVFHDDEVKEEIDRLNKEMLNIRDKLGVRGKIDVKLKFSEPSTEPASEPPTDAEPTFGGARRSRPKRRSAKRVYRKKRTRSPGRSKTRYRSALL